MDAELPRMLEELERFFGVSEGVETDKLISLLSQKQVQGCAAAIAALLRLPIGIRIAYVPASYRPGSGERFHTQSLVVTDDRGRAVSSIAAQVEMPEHLPLYGSAALRGFQVTIRLSENCCMYPEATLVLVAHELTHVLLSTLRHPQRENELYTDLVPLFLGFGKVARTGRKVTRTSSEGSTETTTYGYLTDRQFESAITHINSSLRYCRIERDRLLRVAAMVRHQIGTAAAGLDAYARYLTLLNKRRPTRMKMEHAQRLVEMHARDLETDRRTTVSECSLLVTDTESSLRSMGSNMAYDRHVLKALAENLESAKVRVSATGQAIRADNAVLGKYIGLRQRILGATE